MIATSDDVNIEAVNAFQESNDAQQQIELSQSAAIWGRKTLSRLVVNRIHHRGATS
jgi:hypothetical protein